MRNWISHHPGREHMPRHRHARGYAALILAGGYTEAGDHGRLRVQPGHVVIHPAYEAHQDHFGSGGATVLNLPLNISYSHRALTGYVPDPDSIARLAERDIAAAAAALEETFQPLDLRLGDWPDKLAAALASGLDIDIGSWAAEMKLAPQSVSRGFRQAYGVSPKRYRMEQRTLRALEQLRTWSGSLAALAAESGFADQAHLTRSLVALTGLTPRQLRVNCVQA